MENVNQAAVPGTIYQSDKTGNTSGNSNTNFKILFKIISSITVIVE